MIKGSLGDVMLNAKTAEESRGRSRDTASITVHASTEYCLNNNNDA